MVKIFEDYRNEATKFEILSIGLRLSDTNGNKPHTKKILLGASEMKEEKSNLLIDGNYIYVTGKRELLWRDLEKINPLAPLKEIFGQKTSQPTVQFIQKGILPSFF